MIAEVLKPVILSLFACVLLEKSFADAATVPVPVLLGGFFLEFLDFHHH
jgi:hypothetical protein